MNHNRTLRAPSTITKVSNLQSYNNALAQTRFRLLHMDGLRPPTTVTKSTKGQADQASQSKPPNTEQKATNSPPVSTAPVSSPSTRTSSASRLPPHQSKSTLTRPATSKLPQVRGATVARSVLSNTRVQSERKPNSPALTDTKAPQKAQADTTSLDIITLLGHKNLNSIIGDVGEIRKLLEKLFTLLQKTQEPRESLEEENARLRKEIGELKLALQMNSMKSHQVDTRQVVILEKSGVELKESDDAGRPSVYYSPTA